MFSLPSLDLPLILRVRILFNSGCLTLFMVDGVLY